MEPEITITVEKELYNLKQYLSSQPTDLHVTIDSHVPADRYIIPNSLILIVQHAQRHNLYPLTISIAFLKHTVEISYPLQPRTSPNEDFPDIEALIALYRRYFNMPTIHQTNNQFTLSIPLFI